MKVCAIVVQLIPGSIAITSFHFGGCGLLAHRHTFLRWFQVVDRNGQIVEFVSCRCESQEMTSQTDLFIFIDESGNFDFSPSGTSHFVLGGIATLNPTSSATDLISLKYRLLSGGSDVPEFHASENRQEVRNEVFPVLNSLKGVKAHVIYGDKHYLATNLHNPGGIYSLYGKAMIKYFLQVYSNYSLSSITVVFDQTLTKKRRGQFEGMIKPELKKTGIPFNLYFHPMSTENNGQIADYISWAKYVELERKESRPWSSLKLQLKPSEFNIFRNGQQIYY